MGVRNLSCVGVTTDGHSPLHTIFLEAANSAELLATLSANALLFNASIIFHCMVILNRSVFGCWK